MKPGTPSLGERERDSPHDQVHSFKEAAATRVSIVVFHLLFYLQDSVVTKSSFLLLFSPPSKAAQNVEKKSIAEITTHASRSVLV
jgi:hypothetical protein